MEEPMKIDEKEHAMDVLRRFKSFREQPKHCDFIIKAGKESLHVHRDVLCASSNYFDAMLSHNTKEKENGVVEIKRADVECVKKCVDFMYTGKASVTPEKRKDMMYVATLLQLQRLCDAIIFSLQESLDAQSFFATKEIANTYSCRVLEETCKNFALENFRDISLEDGFKKLEKDYIDFLIKSKNTKASESAKCKALIVWASADLDERSEFFEEMLGHLNLLKIPLGYRRYLIEKEPLVFLSNPCLKALLISIMDKANVLAKDFAIKDDGIDNALTMFDTASKSVQVFEPDQKRWTRMQSIPDEINAAQFTAVKIGELIYILSSNRTGHRLAFADATATWIRTPDRARTSGKVTGFVLDGSLYSVDDSSANSVAIERLDSSDGTWAHVTDKRNPHYMSAFFAYQGSFYCIGGFGPSNRYMASFERFDPLPATWSELPPMPTARYGAAAVVLNGKLYVMGGMNGNNSYLRIVESFDFKSETWTTISNMNHMRSHFSACVLEDKIYAVGGTNSNNTIEVFDPYENTWNVVETMTGKNIQAEAIVATHMFA